MQTINVGIIGFGYIGKIHTLAYRDIPICLPKLAVSARLAALLRSTLDTEQDAMEEAGYGVCTTSPDEFFAQPLDLVDICTPNNLHLEQCRRALEAGLAVYCEKPLAVNYEQANTMAELAEKSGAITQVAFVLRYVPAIRQMKAMLEAGAIGEPLNFRGHMFHGSYLDPNRPMSWRLRAAESGGGAFIDLGAHLVDLALYFLGEARAVRAQMRTFIEKRRPSNLDVVRQETVDVDDWTLCSLELASGVVGVLEVTRMAAGASEASGFEIYGSQGALVYRESQPNTVRYHNLRTGQWIEGPGSLPAPAGERPVEQIWPSGKYSQGMMTNAHLAAQYDLLLNIAENKPGSNDFRSAAKVQQVLEAAYHSARRDGMRLQLR
jgi:predicted dehydrogenase